MTKEEIGKVVLILIAFKGALAREELPEHDPVLRAQIEAYLVERMDEVEVLIQKLSRLSV